MDLCIEAQMIPESFYVPAHRIIYEAMQGMARSGMAIDVLTLTEELRRTDRVREEGRFRDGVSLEEIGGAVYLDHLIDSTPTAAHAEYYLDIVRQKHLLRCIIASARQAESQCYTADESADLILSEVEQSFLDITEHQHGVMASWQDTITTTMGHIHRNLEARSGLTGISSGYSNLDHLILGLRRSEMIILAARPSMGKTALAMNIAENVALGRSGDKIKRPVGIFSLEMSAESLATRMLCSHAEVSSYKLSTGFISTPDHRKIMNSADILAAASIYLDDTAGLDVLELRARARRMKKKHNVELIVIDYLQLMRSREYAKQGRQMEVADISNNVKAMAKELKIPVLVLSQLNRSPEQRDKSAKPKLSDLRDSGSIEQDADVVLMLRRPCMYEGDPDHDDKTLAMVDVAKQRNGPTGVVRLNFESDYTRFYDRAQGVDGPAQFSED
jgi:replicative DNA helicase